MKKLLMSITGIFSVFFLLFVNGCTPPTIVEPTIKTPAQSLMYQGCLYGANRGFQKLGASIRATIPPGLTSQVCTCMVTNPEVNSQLNQYFDASFAFKQNPNSSELKRKWRSAKASMELTSKSVLLQCMNSNFRN